MDIAILLARLLLAGIFFVAAIAKLADRAGSRKAITEMVAHITGSALPVQLPVMAGNGHHTSTPAVPSMQGGLKIGAAPRHTDISLHYRLVGEDGYKALAPKLISQDEKREVYEFKLPAYPQGTMGEVEYYFELKLDGHPNRVDGMKKI